MKLRRMFAVLAASTLFAAAGIVAGSATIAGASGGNGATVTHFTASYQDPPGLGNWSCTGEHIYNHGAGAQDSETCIASGDTSGLVPGTYSGSPYTIFPVLGWSGWTSDYYTTVVWATSWTAIVTANSDGTFTINIDAFYNNMPY